MFKFIITILYIFPLNIYHYSNIYYDLHLFPTLFFNINKFYTTSYITFYRIYFMIFFFMKKIYIEFFLSINRNISL